MHTSDSLLLVGAIVGLGVPLLAIFLADGGKTLRRGEYAGRTAGLVVIMMVMWFVDREAGHVTGVHLVTFIIRSVVGVFFMLWSVHRLTDIGWPRWLALLFFVPFGNILFWIVLMAKMPREEAADTAEAGAAEGGVAQQAAQKTAPPGEA